jgi:hypothetical protein
MAQQYILKRKSDDVICGVGFTQFEGVKDLASLYIIETVTDEQAETHKATMKSNDDTKLAANRSKQKTDSTSGKTKLKDLGLTDDEIKALMGK